LFFNQNFLSPSSTSGAHLTTTKTLFLTILSLLLCAFAKRGVVAKETEKKTTKRVKEEEKRALLRLKRFCFSSSSSSSSS